MTILAFANRFPQTLRRVAGVALISTAAAGLDTCGIGRALRTPVVPLLHLAAQHSPWLTARAWAVARNSLAPLLGIAVCNSPALAANQKCCRMIGNTSIAVIAAVLASFRHHDETAGLARLAHLPALVACGEADQITPISHSLAIAAALPHAELLRAPRAGHILELEQPKMINDALVRLVACTATSRVSARVPFRSAAEEPIRRERQPEMCCISTNHKEAI
jgi:pimeloyl-ACP methyl ester carboxylesterase